MLAAGGLLPVDRPVVMLMGRHVHALSGAVDRPGRRRRLGPVDDRAAGPRFMARSSSGGRSSFVSDQWLRCAGKHGTRGVTTRLAGPFRPGRPARSAEPVTPAAPGPVEPVTPAAPVPGRARHASAPRAV